MAVRKRTWRTASGEDRAAWVADYIHETVTIAHGIVRTRRQKSFETRKAAIDFLASTRVEIAQGRHVPESTSITLAEAAKLWIERCVANDLERGTLRNYRTICDAHVLPLLGRHKLARLTTPMVEAFVDEVVRTRSRDLARRALGVVKSIMAETQRRGLASHSPAAPVRVRASKRSEARVTIPSREHVAALLGASTGPQDRALIAVLVFAGLRASELRALRWSDLDLETRMLTVAQRADRWSKIGAPKSAAGRRTVPLPPVAVNALKAWRLASPHSDLVFATASGTVLHHGNLARSLKAMQRRAGLEEMGPHAYRHFAVSSWIEAGFNVKRVQTWAGHSSPMMTLGTYAHVFEAAAADDHDRIEAASLRLVAA